MNKKINLSIVGLITLSVFALFGFFANANSASALTCNSVTVYGTVHTGTPPAWAWFEYSTNYNTVANAQGTPTAEKAYYSEGSFPIEQYISGLSANTTYYYQLVVQNNYGTTLGGINNLRTPACQPQTYTVSTNAGAGGNISPSSQQVNSGNTTTFSVNPNSGYTINSVTGCAGNLSGTTYTTGAITSNCTVTASFNAVQAQNPTVYLFAAPSTIQAGQGSTLNWGSTNATSCSLSQFGNVALPSGTQSVSPASTTSYSITCYGASGTSPATASATITVNQNPQPIIVSLYASPSTIQSGQSSTLSWNSQNATSCSSSWSGSTAISGSQPVSPASTTTYNITCYGASVTGPATASATVYVNQVQTCRDTSANNYGGNLPCTYNVQTCQDINALNYRGVLPCTYQPVNYQPTVVLYADQASVPFNGSATVRWLTTNATSCFASGGSQGWAGSKSIGPGAFYTGSLTGSTTYYISCSNNAGSASDTVTINVRGIVVNNPTPTSLVLISSSVDRNQPILPTVDNTRPHPGDEINYTVNYQNIGTGAITGLTLQMNLPYEVDYMFSNPINPTKTGNTLVFNLGTLRANGQGTATVRVRVRENIPAGTNLNFPATLSYVDPSGQRQSVNANVSAQVWSDPAKENVTPAVVVPLGANVFGAGFLPANLFGWLILLVLVLALALLAKYLFGSPFSKQTTTTSNQPSGAKKTTTTTIQ